MTPSVAPKPHALDPFAALLSYLVPGLGQMVQGRVGKGVLFFVCLYGLFFYGMAMGQYRNVWLPEPTNLPDVEMPVVGRVGGAAKALAQRMQFAGQFWIGAAAWPAVAQYLITPPPPPGGDPPPSPVLGRFMQAPTEAGVNDLQRGRDTRWDLGWVFTVIAGMLNILVIYDALAGPVVRDDDLPAELAPTPSPAPEGTPA